MAILKPDKTTNLNGVTVNEYFLTKHNPNHIDMPQYKITDLIGITVHNTDRIKVASGTTPAEQYTRATVNGNMDTVRVHFYVDDVCAWQNLPLELSSWHTTDGANGTGNRKTISIECIMNGSGDAKDKKAEENCARLVAYLLNKYNLTTRDIYSHWYFFKKKYCPAYILPHWNEFKENVKSFMTAPKKSIDELAREVISGKWGVGEDRKNRLTSAGYSYSEVQARVNELMKPKTYTVKQGDTITSIAKANNTTVDKLVEDNKLIQSGMVLKL